MISGVYLALLCEYGLVKVESMNGELEVQNFLDTFKNFCDQLLLEENNYNLVSVRCRISETY